MGTTLADLRPQIRLHLASETDWPDATLDGWIADAIRFYSVQFPREYYHDQSLTTGTQTYDLPGDHGFHGIVSVEYPTGEDPQSFLDEVDEWDDAFQDQDDVYCIMPVDDTTAIASDTEAGSIKFAETVATGETARIRYLGTHRLPDAGDDDAQITVPPRHWEALIAFVEFRSHLELETDEAVTVSNISIILAQLGQEARYLWNRYKEVMTRLEYLESAGQSAIIDWSEQIVPRIY
jgi:hypothetical protein